MSGAIHRMWVTLSIIPVRAICACPSSSASPNLTLSFSCLQPTFPLTSTFIHFYLSSALFIGLSKSDSCLEEKGGEKKIPPLSPSSLPSWVGLSIPLLYLSRPVFHTGIYFLSALLPLLTSCTERYTERAMEKRDVAPNK